MKPSKPPPLPFGARRAREIWAQRRDQNDVTHAMTPAERAYVQKRWYALPGSACYMDAFLEILNGPEEPPSPAHNEQRNYRIERTPYTSQFDVQGRGTLRLTTSDLASVEERYCAHCRTWVECRGVLGGLQFLAFHDPGDCVKKGPQSEQNPPDPGLT